MGRRWQLRLWGSGMGMKDERIAAGASDSEVAEAVRLAIIRRLRAVLTKERGHPTFLPEQLHAVTFGAMVGAVQSVRAFCLRTAEADDALAMSLAAAARTVVDACREIEGVAPLATPDLSPPVFTVAARDVLAERKRQVLVEGWSEEHDDRHRLGEMAGAAACYALFRSQVGPDIMDADVLSTCWPWSDEWWKPKDVRRDLVRAAALLIAEIERLDRRTARLEADHAAR